MVLGLFVLGFLGIVGTGFFLLAQSAAGRPRSRPDETQSGPCGRQDDAAANPDIEVVGT